MSYSAIFPILIGKIAYLATKLISMPKVEKAAFQFRAAEAPPVSHLAALKDVDVLQYMAKHVIDATYLVGIKELTGYPDAAIADWLSISTRTLRTYEKDKKVLDKNLGEQVVMLWTVFLKGLAVFGNAAAFDTWLDTANFFFDGKKPTMFLDTTSGLRYIFDRLTAMEYGDNV